MFTNVNLDRVSDFWNGTLSWYALLKKVDSCMDAFIQPIFDCLLHANTCSIVQCNVIPECAMTKQSNAMGVGWCVTTADRVPKAPSLWGPDDFSEWMMRRILLWASISTLSCEWVWPLQWAKGTRVWCWAIDQCWIYCQTNESLQGTTPKFRFCYFMFLLQMVL